jgi:hypothetical protein
VSVAGASWEGVPKGEPGFVGGGGGGFEPAVVTVNTPDRLALPTGAEIVTLVFTVTALVLTVKVTEVSPADAHLTV